MPSESHMSAGARRLTVGQTVDPGHALNTTQHCTTQHRTTPHWVMIITLSQAKVHPLCGNTTAHPGSWQQVECFGKVGRFVTIRSLEPSELALSEVRVYSPGELISAGRPASQSFSSAMSAEAIRPTLTANADYEANLLAEFATDGELSARGQPGRCAVTGVESQPWWTVSLDYSYRVRSVLLWFGDEEMNVPDATITVHVGEYTTCAAFLIEQL